MEKESGKGKNHENTYSLIFDGEYKDNKKWNGFGYNGSERHRSESDEPVYELKNGKGTIKDYYGEGNLFFEGEYLNGELYGKYKEYYSNVNLSFKGEYKYGKKWNGKGYDL